MRPPKTLSHPDMADPGVLRRIADRLRSEYGAERVIVYGSVAHGDATLDSDIDILVIAPDADKAHRRVARVKAIVRDLSRGLPLSPLVLTPNELEGRLALGDQFITEIVRSGVEL